MRVIIVYLQEMLLDSSLQLLSPVLMIPSLLLALLLETSMGSPPGEWVGTVSVTWYTDQLQLQFVGQAMSLKLILGLGLGQTLLLSYQH